MDEQLKTQLIDAVSELKERGKALIDDEDIRQKMSLAKAKTELFIRKNPIASIAGGVLVGFILGSLFSSDD